MTDKIVIIGAGMAGFGAAHYCHNNSYETTIFEKNNYYGGHASTYIKDGFTFDDGPHISFTKDKRIRKLLDKNTQNNVVSFDSFVDNYWKGFRIKHPAQVNLFGLPKDIVVRIIREIFESQKSKKENITNYEEWLYATFGKTFSETFPMEYTKKFHTTSAKNLDIDWIGPRLYQPDLNEVLLGALSNDTQNLHYVTKFHYPKNGGFVAFLDQFRLQTKLELNHEVVNIDTVKKIVEFKTGRIEKYDHLISSMPLPVLISVISDVPSNVLSASKKLACTSCVFVNIGVKRKNISNSHWTYFYDNDVLFSRLSYPYLYSSNNAPKNCSSVQAEIYFSDKYKPLTKSPEEYIDATIADLIKCNIINESDEIVFREAKFNAFANVIFDLDRKENLSIVHKFLDKIGIKYCGRYGDWNYSWTDESFISGENAAKKIIKIIQEKSKI